MHEFYFDYIKNKYGNKLRLLFTDTDSLKYETETEVFMSILIRIRKCLILVIILLSQKYHDDSNVLVVRKMKDELGGVVMKEFVCLRPNMYSILVRDSNQSKKAKVVNKNVFAKIS